MEEFVYTGLPAKVIFGVGTTGRAKDELEALGIARALVLTTPYQERLGDQIAGSIGTKSAGVLPIAAMHTPVSVTEEALDVFRRTGADGVVSVGGGSTIGLGKAIALRTDAPQLVLPTTYAGSEMTSIIGQTEKGRKTTQRSLKVLPETVIYDVSHTLTLPVTMSVTSGMNAVAHAVEALYSEGANPLLSLVAEEGIRSLASALPRIVETPESVEARSDALYGAWLCAVCLGSGGVALHHKLCHVLGGSFDLPHAETHTAVLPHALAYNAAATPEALRRLQNALDTGDPAGRLFDIAARGGATMALRDLGMPEEGIAEAVRITLEYPYPNPRRLESAPLEELLARAWAGERP